MNFLTKFKDLTIEALKDNWKLIIGLYLLFIIAFVAAWILSGAKIGSVISNMPALNTTAPNMSANVGAGELFINNEWEVL